jgi:hypothetical protein
MPSIANVDVTNPTTKKRKQTNEIMLSSSSASTMMRGLGGRLSSSLLLLRQQQQCSAVVPALAQASTTILPSTRTTTPFSTLLVGQRHGSEPPAPYPRVDQHNKNVSSGSRRLMTTTMMKMNQPQYRPQLSHVLPSSFSQQHQQRRFFTPLTKDEEEKEKVRVQSLTPFQKDQELRSLNRQLAKLELLKGINTGEIYTWSGRYKALARDYGMPLFAYYWIAWSATCVVVYGGLTILDIDALALIGQLDQYTGWDLSAKVDPEMGKIGVAILCNELLEPIRLPAVILTVKPVMDHLFPPKY